jgi:hypothetical protein
MSIIQEISLADINANPQNYNSNNHWIDGKLPDDYKSISHQTDSQFWLHKFRSTFETFEFSPSDLAFFKSILGITRLHNKISNIHKEDIMDIVEKYKDVNALLKGGKFIRTEGVSLKYGKHGVKPYDNLYDIIESILTSPDGHCPIYPTTDKLKLYIVPWVNINKFKEFRVFVCDNKLTAISQQHLYESNDLLKDLSDDDRHDLIHKWITIIVDAWFTEIKDKIDHMSSYVYDFAILDDDSPYFIEINPFGKEYSSGSSAFHWITDEDKLYGKDDIVYFRYVV